MRSQHKGTVGVKWVRTEQAGVRQRDKDKIGDGRLTGI